MSGCYKPYEVQGRRRREGLEAMEEMGASFHLDRPPEATQDPDGQNVKQNVLQYLLPQRVKESEQETCTKRFVDAVLHKSNCPLTNAFDSKIFY